MCVEPVSLITAFSAYFPTEFYICICLLYRSTKNMKDKKIVFYVRLNNKNCARKLTMLRRDVFDLRPDLRIVQYVFTLIFIFLLDLITFKQHAMAG